MNSSFYFYANPYQPRSLEAARLLAGALLRRGCSIYTEKWLADEGIGKEMSLDDLSPDIRALVAFGGDGTLLRAVGQTTGKGIPLLGVHAGTVGFLMTADAGQPEETAALLLKDSLPMTEYPLLQIIHEGTAYPALNDVSLTRGEHPGVIEFSVCSQGEVLMRAHGDGVVVSTPLGATAYALSAGGPIVRPDTPCLIVTPIAAREMILRPVVLPLHAPLSLRAHGRDRRRLQLAIDGQTLLPITEETEIGISIAPEKARLIRPEGRNFFTTLRKKQGVWNQEEQE